MAVNLEALEEVLFSSIEAARANEHYRPVTAITDSLIFAMV
jgi:hypothetical protein